MFGLAWRRLWATPVFTIFAVVSLAVGVGVTTAVYSVVVSLTSRGLSVPDADRIGMVVGNDPLNGGRQTFRSVLSRPDFDDVSRSLTTLGPLAASAAFYQSVVAPSMSEAVPGEAVTGNYFSALGLVPEAGRLLQSQDDDAASPVVVLSSRFWRLRFASDPDVIGRTVRIGSGQFEIVGVGPEGFNGLNNRLQAFTAVWVPLASTALFPSSAAPPRDPADRRRRQLTVFAALRPGVSVEAAAAEVSAAGAVLDRAFPIDMRMRDDTQPQVTPRGWSVRTLDAVRRELGGQFSTVEAAITSIVGLILVVACTNLANLVLARGSSRVHELAVRRALGASRVRLVAGQLAESVLLAAMGSVGAFLVTRLLLIWFTGAELPISAGAFVQLEPRLDAATLTLSVASVLASLVVFGLAPAIQLTRVQLRSSLATEGGTTGHPRWRTRRTLIAVQVMISLSFFLMAAFAVRLVHTEDARPSGVDVERLAIGQLNFHLPPWNDSLARGAVDRLTSLATGQPGLDAMAVLSGMPFGTTYTPGANVTPIDKPFVPGREGYTYAPLIAATPSVFATLGVPILSGRGFDARDDSNNQPVAVLSAMTARQLFGTAQVLGRTFLLRADERTSSEAGEQALTVIGIAGDTDTQHRGSRHSGVVYVPLSQHFEPGLALVGRTSGDPRDLIGPLKSLAQRADPDLVLDRPGPAALTITGLYVLLDAVSRLAGALAALALALGMAGLFGVMSHLVSRRTREMGVRLALGAEPRDIRMLVLRDGFQPVASGLTMGYLIAGLVRLVIRSVYDSPLDGGDIAAFVLAPVPIIIAGLIACYWPATRASRVHPNVALREL